MLTLQLISWNYGQFYMSIQWLKQRGRPGRASPLMGGEDGKFLNTYRKEFFWISCLSFELYSFYCVHHSTKSIIVDIMTYLQSKWSFFLMDHRFEDVHPRPRSTGENRNIQSLPLICLELGPITLIKQHYLYNHVLKDYSLVRKNIPALKDSIYTWC